MSEGGAEAKITGSQAVMVTGGLDFTFLRDVEGYNVDGDGEGYGTDEG